jgi:hypothetical protein
MPDSKSTKKTKSGRRSSIEVMKNDDLLAATRTLAERSRVVEADLVAHLAEIDARELYRDRAFSSLFSFCVGELGFSGDVAYNRILVARASRRWPAVLEALRSGRVHLAGLRLLVPHLTEENHLAILAEANGKSKRKIEELMARLAPRPGVPEMIQQLPDPAAVQAALAAAMAPATSASAKEGPAAPNAVVQPLSDTTFSIQFTGGRALCEKLRQAQDLLRHRVPDGNLATVIEKALDVLLTKVKKERFALVSKPRKTLEQTPVAAKGRKIPAAVRRTVYVRDGGRCAFVDPITGRRCEATSGLEYDHLDGYEKSKRHDARHIRLICRPHHRLVTKKYPANGSTEPGHVVRDEPFTRPGTGGYLALL